MTVSELIKMLATHPPDLRVVFRISDLNDDDRYIEIDQSTELLIPDKAILQRNDPTENIVRVVELY